MNANTIKRMFLGVTVIGRSGPAAAVREARAVGAAVVLALATLLLAGPSPARALADLTHSASDAPLAPVAPAAALLAWALAGWLAVVLAAVAAGRLPGRLGRRASAVAARVAPVAVRRVAGLALGLAVATGAVAASPAGAETRRPAAASLDWPGAPGPAGTAVAAPALDWPIARPPAPPAPDAVVVRPGDTLWALAAARLPRDAGPAAVARAWPAWWTANRAVIGADPDLLHPGTRLVPPVAPTPR